MKENKFEFGLTFKSLGLVFGDIGTSPIYTFTVIFLLLPNIEKNIIGVSSLIIWSLIVLVTGKYVWLAMSLSKRGEGGTVVLLEILLPYLKKGRSIIFVLFLAYMGIALLIGDGIITPAISILSAVEGIKILPGMSSVSQNMLVVFAALIALLLILFQKRGTEKVAGAFAPIMFIWFCFLGIFGFIYILQYPTALNALNPYYGLHFLFTNGFLGFFTLSEVILCATGGEALYADMGHMKRRPITQAWGFVFVALALNYMGQASFLIQHPKTQNILFGMIYNQAPVLYIPFLILSIFATIIASQAMITGIFSIVYQAINVRLLPMLNIKYTSDKIKEQIYIGSVNWFLLVFVIIIMFVFQNSDRLAAAYGLAVTGAMVLAGIMMIMIFYFQRKMVKLAATVFATFVATVFFSSTLLKIPSGGYWSIILSCIPLSIILVYTFGQKRMFRNLNPVLKDDFLDIYNHEYPEMSKIKGTAIFLVRDVEYIPPYILHTMFQNGIIYENNIFVSVIRRDGPWGIKGEFKDDLATGLKLFKISLGYMERENIIKIIREAKIKERVIFYGTEEITTNRFIWKIFAAIKKLVPSYVEFYRLPVNKLHGVATRINM